MALKTLNLPATFFVSSGFVGLPKQREIEFLRSRLQVLKQTTGGLSADDLRRLSAEGFTIGGHTCNHMNLAQSYDLVELRKEILVDKQRLETIIGKEIHYFSYPFGLCYNARIDLAELLKEAGYKGAVTTASGLNRSGANPYLLSRELTPIPMAPCVFRARTLGAYEAVAFLRHIRRRFDADRQCAFTVTNHACSSS